MKTVIDTRVAEINRIKKQLKAVEAEQLNVRRNSDYDKCEAKMAELKLQLKVAAEDLIFSINTQLEIKNIISRV